MQLTRPVITAEGWSLALRVAYSRALSYDARAHFVPVETCENHHPGIKSPPSPKHRRCDLGRSESEGASAPNHHRRRFFVLAMARYGGGARDTFGCAGLLSSRSANPRTAATLTCLAASGGSSITKGTHA